MLELWQKEMLSGNHRWCWLMKRQAAIDYLIERTGKKNVYSTILDWSGIYFISGNVVVDYLFTLHLCEK